MLQQVCTCKDEQNDVLHNPSLYWWKKREKYSIESSEKFSIGFSKLKGKPEQDQCYPNAGEMDNTSDGICKETVPTPKSAGKSEQYPIMENCSIDR